jgi:hypothetical protein
MKWILRIVRLIFRRKAKEVMTGVTGKRYEPMKFGD